MRATISESGSTAAVSDNRGVEDLMGLLKGSKFLRIQKIRDTNFRSSDFLYGRGFYGAVQKIENPGHSNNKHSIFPLKKMLIATVEAFFWPKNFRRGILVRIQRKGFLGRS